MAYSNNKNDEVIRVKKELEKLEKDIEQADEEYEAMLRESQNISGQIENMRRNGLVDKWTINKNLTCSVCELRFDIEDRKPVLFGCAHSICMRCFFGILDNKTMNLELRLGPNPERRVPLSCDVCQKISFFPSVTTEQTVPKNHTLIAALEALQDNDI